MISLLIYPILTTCFYYLGARAVITRWLWSEYPKWFDHFMFCAACSGFWYGMLIAAILRLPFLHYDPWDWKAPVLVGLCSIVWTPLLAALHTKAMLFLGEPEQNG